MAQETKCENDKFPLAAVQDLGYKYVVHRGQASYNGVAIISRIRFKNLIEKDFCDKNDCRYIGAEFEFGKDNTLKLHNFYVPAGGDEPDTDINLKFKHKLDFLDEMHLYLKDQIADGQYHIIVGDMNISIRADVDITSRLIVTGQMYELSRTRQTSRNRLGEASVRWQGHLCVCATSRSLAALHCISVMGYCIR